MRAIWLLVFGCAAGLLTAGSGCAPAYHHYADCRINCHYCPPSPLPYVHYPGCVCHSCAAQKHMAVAVPMDDPKPNSGEQATD